MAGALRAKAGMKVAVGSVYSTYVVLNKEGMNLGISQFIRYQFKFQHFICHTCESRYKATFAKLTRETGLRLSPE